jgi:hypothetical protein
MVQSIEKLHPKFQTDVLGDSRCLGQRYVKIRQVRSPQDIAGDAVGTIRGIVHGIKLREARIVALVIRIVLQRNIGKTVGMMTAPCWS